MPEFFPKHVPTDADDFLAGYLAAAEWLMLQFGESGDSDEENNWPRDDEGEPLTGSNGWSKEALARATKDCARFFAINRCDLARYEKYTGRDMSHAGHDFWLTRNGHGAGFFDRDYHGCDDVGERLSNACLHDEVYIYIGDDDFLHMA